MQQEVVTMKSKPAKLVNTYLNRNSDSDIIYITAAFQTKDKKEYLNFPFLDEFAEKRLVQLFKIAGNCNKGTDLIQKTVTLYLFENKLVGFADSLYSETTCVPVVGTCVHQMDYEDFFDYIEDYFYKSKLVA